jgi:hypothetical protein
MYSAFKERERARAIQLAAAGGNRSRREDLYEDFIEEQRGVARGGSLAATATCASTHCLSTEARPHDRVFDEPRYPQRFPHSTVAEVLEITAQSAPIPQHVDDPVRSGLVKQPRLATGI